MSVNLYISPPLVSKHKTRTYTAFLLLLGLCVFSTIQAQVQIGNYVFFDANQNGISDDSPANGLNGVTVELWNAGSDSFPGGGNDIFVSSMVTANNALGEPGYYLFDNVADGKYFLKFPTKFEGFFLTKAGEGTSATGSDPSILTGQTGLINTADGDTDEMDAGFAYLLPVCPSVCEKQFILQATAGRDSVLFDVERDSLALPKFDPSLGSLLRVDFESRAVIDKIYLFENLGTTPRQFFFYYNDSMYTSGPGISGELIYTAQDSAVPLTTLAASNNVPPGVPQFTGPDSKVDSIRVGSFGVDTTFFDAALPQFIGTDSLRYYYRAIGNSITPASGNFARIVLTQARFEITVRYVYCRPICGSIGNLVWNDVDKDGLKDPNETGLANITVTLYDENRNPVAVTRTDAFGDYTFNNVLPGNYTVGFSLPPDYVFSPQNVGADSTLDSNPNLQGITASFLLDTLENRTDIDAGMFLSTSTTASLGNYIWFDEDGNGRQDPLPVADVTVSLYDAATNTFLASTLTNADGEYYFRDLTPGTYYVIVTPPVGYSFTEPNVTGDDNDSDVNPSGKTPVITLVAGQDDYTWDAGLVLKPAGTASVGDFVWNDLDKDGIQDVGEPGIPGIMVILYDVNNVPIDTTVTDAFGAYSFPAVNVEIAPGVLQTSYYIEFKVPTTYAPTLVNTGLDDNKDSDINLLGKTAFFVLNVGDDKTDIDAGLVLKDVLATASLGDYVWLDKDNDGLQGADESGVPGVTVTLFNDLNQIVGVTTTDVQGFYLFPSLKPGDYTVQFSNLPFATAFTTQNAGAPNEDSDPSPIDGKTNVINLAANENNRDVDAGLIDRPNNGGAASIGDRVWEDLNADGIQDDGEPGVANVTVILREADGTIVDIVVTDGDGNYVFNGLEPGDYYITFTDIPLNLDFTGEDAGLDDLTDSDADPVTGETPIITLARGESNYSVDAGLVRDNQLTTATLGDIVWWDKNGDGIQDPLTEPGVSGVTVTLYDEFNNIVGSRTTGGEGRYLFTGLEPGNYRVVFMNFPAGFTLTTQDAGAETEDSDANPLTGQTDLFPLAAGQTFLDIDAGLITPTRASIGNFVWDDVNGDGVQDLGEPGIAGVTAELVDALTGLPVGATVTDAKGFYYFNNIEPGDYFIRFTQLPPFSTFTQSDATGDDMDSDVDPDLGIIPNFTVLPGETNYTYDAGIFISPSASLTGIVWFDKDRDGLRDPEEALVPGVTVSLVDINGDVVSTTVTGSDGVYFFDNLLSGDYEVIFTTIPEGSLLTTPNVNGNANDTQDSDIDYVTPPGTFPITATGGTVTVNAGDNVKGPDGGIIPFAGLKGRAWTDVNQNGYQNTNDIGIRGVVVTLCDAANNPIRTTITGENGAYEFLNLFPEVSYIVKFDSVANRIWTLQLASTDTTKDSDVYNYLTAPTSAKRGATPLLAPLLAGEIRPFIDAGYLVENEVFPIELLYFTGAIKGEDGMLKWETTSEINASHFLVERSFDGFVLDRSNISQIPTKGNEKKRTVYAATDRGVGLLNIEKVWYRLKMVDIDGTYTYSNVVELNLDQTKPDIYVFEYPNPAKDVVYVDYQLFAAKYGDIKVVNAMGQTMYSQALDASNTMTQLEIRTSDWASGVYFIEIYTDNAKAIRKIVIE